MPKPKNDPSTKICETILRLLASKGWSDLTLEQIAKAAKIPPAQLRRLSPVKENLLPALIGYVDQKTLTSVGKVLKQGTPHDRLFEVMMARFDVLQNYRPAVLNIMKATKADPTLARLLIPAHIQAMQKMLEVAGLQQDGLKQVAANLGLLIVYGLALLRWQNDDSKDLAATMSILDRQLRRASKLAELLFGAA